WCSFRLLELVTNQALRLGRQCRPSAGGKQLLPYISLEAAAWWNVELANSKVFTVGVPSITFERVFNTSAYAVWSYASASALVSQKLLAIASERSGAIK